MLSIIVPSRNEKYLQNTIFDLLHKAKGDIEIIAVLDGYWITPAEFISDPRVNYIHFPSPRGMRNAINSGVAIAKGKYVMKIDAHCMVSEGFDKALIKDCGDDWVVVPRRYALDPEKWEIEDNPKYPIDYMYLDRDLHGRVWSTKNRDVMLEYKKIDDLMSSQGSCWFMRREYFSFLELMDEDSYGEFAREFQEIGLKCWLSGGRVVVNKNAWYAHWHKPSSVGRGYRLKRSEIKKADDFMKNWMTNKNGWYKQKYPLIWLIDKFAPVPTWSN